MLRSHFALEVWPDEEAPSREILLEKSKECDGLLTLLTDKIDEEFLSQVFPFVFSSVFLSFLLHSFSFQCPKVKIVSQMAVGYNNIDIAYCTKNGIAVTNTPDCLTETTAEVSEFSFFVFILFLRFFLLSFLSILFANSSPLQLTLALVLAVGRRIVEADHYVRDHKWKVEWHPSLLLGQDLHNHVYGIVGFGRIGQRVATLMKTLGAKVVYTDLIRRQDLEESFGVTYLSLEELIQTSDFISVHCNLTKETRFLFDGRKIAMMKPNCIFINTARGAIVDQKALTRALAEKRIAGAGLDVFEREPISENDPLLQLDNVVLVPHIGSASRDTREAMATMAAEGLLSYFHGVGEIKHLVNRDVLAGKPLLGRGKPIPE
jgi:glyoxylate reductase